MNPPLKYICHKMHTTTTRTKTFTRRGSCAALSNTSWFKLNNDLGFRLEDNGGKVSTKVCNVQRSTGAQE